MLHLCWYADQHLLSCSLQAGVPQCHTDTVRQLHDPVQQELLCIGALQPECTSGTSGSWQHADGTPPLGAEPRPAITYCSICCPPGNPCTMIFAPGSVSQGLIHVRLQTAPPSLHNHALLSGPQFTGLQSSALNSLRLEGSWLCPPHQLVYCSPGQLDQVSSKRAGGAGRARNPSHCDSCCPSGSDL